MIAKRDCGSSRGAATRGAIVVRLALLSFLWSLLVYGSSDAEELRLLSVGLRARISGATLLGDDQSEEFHEYDVAASVALPWDHYSPSNWGAGTRLTASAGGLRGGGESALVVSLIPGFSFGSKDGRFTLDLGAGMALLSRHRFGTQDFGGPFQFALTVGASFPLYKQLGVGYRYLHYSDAGVNGPDTIGADFHMVEFTYRR